MRKQQNFRDIGGYKTIDGRTVKKGLIYRSSAPGFFNEEELQELRDLHLKTVLDFRTPKVAAKLPDPELPGCNIIEICAGLENALEDFNYSPRELFDMMFDEDQRGNFVATFTASYTAVMAFTNEAYQRMFDELLAGNVPLMFHCSQGKDRTGIAAALIHLALGVKESDVARDYLLSNEYRKIFIDKRIAKYAAFANLSKNIKTAFMMIEGVLPESVHMLMCEIQERYGNYENYFLKEYGLDKEKLEKLRDMYLEGETEEER